MTQLSIVSPRIERLMARYHEIGQFNGAVLVSHNNKIVFEKAYGYANREWDIPNTVDTKFRLGSATKPFTATLVMDLAEDRELDTDGTISDYLPDFRQDVGDMVTIHHLLTHTGGISMPKMTLEEYWDLFQTRMTVGDLIGKLCSGDLDFKPGERFSYSSAGYIVLGAIVERVTGKSYGQVLRERILDPFDMPDTGIDDPEEILSKRASGYQANYRFGNARYKYMPSSFSSGALYSTVRDMYKLDQALNTERLLAGESKSLMFKPHVKANGDSYGYGWFVQETPVAGSTQTRVFHGGDVSGFCAFMVRVLETEDCVVLLSNQEGVSYGDIAFNVMNVLNGEEPTHPKPYVADILRNSLFSGGLDRALGQYAELCSRGLDNYNTDEDEISELGYDLLAINQIDAAIQVLRINVELHGESSNAYDSLGEAYYRAEEYDKALVNYQRAIENDPGNDNATAMIAKIEGLNGR